MIASGDETALDAETLAKKSVAVQGLVALEFVLFGTGSVDLASGTGADRCAYGRAVSENIAGLAEEVLAGWQADDGIAALWRNPSADNPLFRDESEQINGLIKMIGDALEIIKVQRLDPVLRDDRATMRPRSALFWRSDNWVRSLAANVAGLRALMEAAKLDRTVAGDARRVIGTTEFELANAARAFAGTDIPVRAIAESEEAYGRMVYGRLVIAGLADIAKGRLRALYGLSSGFSSLDGD